MFKKLPNSTRKFIRLKKAQIRRQFLGYKEQEEAIANMYNKILNKIIVKGVEVLEPTKIEIKKPKKRSAISKKVKQENKNIKKYKKKKVKK